MPPSQSPTRDKQIEDAVKIALDELPPDRHWDTASAAEGYAAVWNIVRQKIPDVTPDEILIAVDVIVLDNDFELSIFREIKEIGKRYGAAADEKIAELLARAARAGDQQAIKLLAMEAHKIKVTKPCRPK